MPEPESDMPQFETFTVGEDDEEAGQVAPVIADEFETNAAPGATFSDPTASFAELNEDEASQFETSSATDFQVVDFSIVTPDAPVAATEEVPADEGRHENMMRRSFQTH